VSGATPGAAGHAAIGAAIRAATLRGQAALVAYLTAGFPRRERFVADLARVAAHADVVEIGVPFTDPMADGVTIQRASHSALTQGVSLAWILAELTAQPVRPAAPLILMSYLNPLLAFGLERLPAAAQAAGVAAFIVPDLPFEECAELRAALNGAGVGLVQMVTPVTPPERLAMLCREGQGFIYAVTMTGTTGKSVEVPDSVLEYLAAVRAAAPIPVCAGFGIRSADQVARLAGRVDGVVVGSALVEVLERGEDPAVFLDGLRPRAAGRGA
jgi:tryptophan synthase alpha chain